VPCSRVICKAACYEKEVGARLTELHLTKLVRFSRCWINGD